MQRKFAKLIPERPVTPKAAIATSTQAATTTTTTTKRPTRPPPTESPFSANSFKQEQQDLASINNDLALLSSLLGRKVSLTDLPELTKSFGVPPPPKSITNIPAETPPPASQNEVLDNVHPGQDKTRVKSEIESGLPKIKPQAFDTYGKTDDALLATLLKQNGIGPANNNIPVQLLLHQVMGAASTPFSRNSATTTAQPPAPVRRRPIVDGLTWLWRTWQETAPRKKRPSSDLTFGGPDFSNEEYTEGNTVSLVVFIMRIRIQRLPFVFSSPQNPQMIRCPYRMILGAVF